VASRTDPLREALEQVTRSYTLYEALNIAREALARPSHDCNDFMREIPGFGWDCSVCWSHRENERG
jgi:hypothetical protein